MEAILLTKGKVVEVDDEDYEKVSQFDWYAHETNYNGKKKYYAMRRPHIMGIKRELLLHRFILNLKKRDTVRFIDGNSLNCQKSNLQVTRRSNQNDE